MPDPLLEQAVPLDHDLDHPLDAYASHLKDSHAHRVGEYFEELVRTSGVDEQENIRLVAELRALEGAVARSKSARLRWRLVRAAGIVIAVASGVIAFVEQGWTYLLLGLIVGVFLFDMAKVRGRLSVIRSQLEHLDLQLNAKQAQAQAQMEPLNRLHTWGVAPALFQATLPAVRLDPYMSSDRLQDLVATYGLTPQYPDSSGGRSVLFPQSGALGGNPFVVQRSLRHWMGTKTYWGSLVIHWTEQQRNADGKYVTVHRTQTLTASVVKPCPMYQEGTALIFGHEAAPTLSFSRRPSSLSGMGEGRVADFRINRRISKIQRQARRAVKTGRTQFTVMSNEEFEALFGATDRDDEVAFRLLFTPLAQQEMVKLLEDRTVGFGDDFSLAKRGAINVVESQHLHAARLDDDPRLFHSLELAEARRIFQTFHEHYFRSLYFSLAPLLTIPLYREPRSLLPAASWPDVPEPSEWDLEAMANLIGEAAFKHPQSVTRNVLKTTSAQIAPTVQAVDVTAHGYGGIGRVDYVHVRGGDGRVHAVAVPWTEYYGVQAWRRMLVGVVQRHDADGTDPLDAALLQDWNSALRQHGADRAGAVVRGALAGCLLGG